MSDLEEISFDYLIFNMKLYEKFEVKWDDFKEYTDEQIDYYDDGQEFKRNVYKTDYPKQMWKLISFISNDNRVHGKCINCNVDTFFILKSNKISDEIKNKNLRSYIDEQIDDDNFYNIPEIEYVIKSRTIKLIEELNDGYFDKYFICPKCGTVYRSSFHIELDKNKKIYIEKIGQYPDIIKFKDEFKDEYKRILKKANALNDFMKSYYSSIDGYYVGAFAYMRRVFEKFLMYKYNNVKSIIDNNQNEEFNKMKTERKIDILKGYLPEFAYKEKVFYKFISAGIHSLDENECKEYYPIIFQSIIIILYEENALLKKKELEEDTKKLLNKANSNISKKNK